MQSIRQVDQRIKKWCQCDVFAFKFVSFLSLKLHYQQKVDVHNYFDQFYTLHHFWLLIHHNSRECITFLIIHHKLLEFPTTARASHHCSSFSPLLKLPPFLQVFHHPCKFSPPLQVSYNFCKYSTTSANFLQILQKFHHFCMFSTTFANIPPLLHVFYHFNQNLQQTRSKPQHYIDISISNKFLRPTAHDAFN